MVIMTIVVGCTALGDASAGAVPGGGSRERLPGVRPLGVEVESELSDERIDSMFDCCRSRRESSRRTTQQSQCQQSIVASKQLRRIDAKHLFAQLFCLIESECFGLRPNNFQAKLFTRLLSGRRTCHLLSELCTNALAHLREARA